MNLSKNNPLRKAFKPPTISQTNQNIDKKSVVQSNNDHNEQNFIKEKNFEGKQYFKIFFSKDIKKKHKIFEEGVLIIASKSCQIFNSEGNKVHDLTKPKNINELIENNEPISFGFSSYGISYSFFSIFNSK